MWNFPRKDRVIRTKFTLFLETATTEINQATFLRHWASDNRCWNSFYKGIPYVQELGGKLNMLSRDIEDILKRRRGRREKGKDRERGRRRRRRKSKKK